MLSRVAESLYWTARYVERAEDVTRLLDVNFHALLDAQVEDRGQTWLQIVQLLGDEERYREHYDEATAVNVSDWVLWHDGNPNAVANCITLARENARSVREQISGEMWEAINKLFLLVRGANRRAVSRGPHAFFEELRNGAHLFQGSADATMTHGDPYEFIRLGLQLERAAKTVRIVASRYPIAVALDDDDPARARQLIALLKSCSAFEAYVKRHGTRFEPIAIAEELIRSADFPRAVRYCLASSLDAVSRISSDQGAPHRIHRSAGRDARVRRGRATSRATAVTQTMRGLLDRHPRRRRGGDEGVLLEPRAPDRPRSRCRRRSSSNVADRRARDAVLVRRLDQRGVQRDPPQARTPGRPALLVVRARDRATRRLGRRSTAIGSGTPCTTSTCSSRIRTLAVTARSEVWTPEVFVDDEAAPSLLDRWDLLRESRYVPLEGPIAELAAHVDRRRPGPRSRRRHAADDTPSAAR